MVRLWPWKPSELVQQCEGKIVSDSCLSPRRHHWPLYSKQPFEQPCTILLGHQSLEQNPKEGHCALYLWVESSPEFDDYGFTVGVLGNVNQFLEVVYVVLY